MGSAHGIHTRHEIALDLQVFDHRLDDPIGLGNHIEVILKVTNSDARRQVCGKETGRAGFHCAIQALCYDPVAHSPVLQGQPLAFFFWRQLIRNDIQQCHRNPGIRQVSGDGGSHRAGANNNCSMNFVSHSVISRIGELKFFQGSSSQPFHGCDNKKLSNNTSARAS